MNKCYCIEFVYSTAVNFLLIITQDYHNIKELYSKKLEDIFDDLV